MGCSLAPTSHGTIQTGVLEPRLLPDPPGCGRASASPAGHSWIAPKKEARRVPNSHRACETPHGGAMPPSCRALAAPFFEHPRPHSPFSSNENSHNITASSSAAFSVFTMGRSRHRFLLPEHVVPPQKDSPCSLSTSLPQPRRPLIYSLSPRICLPCTFLHERSPKTGGFSWPSFR